MDIHLDILNYTTSAHPLRAVTDENSLIINHLRGLIDGGAVVITDKALKTWLQTKLAVAGGLEQVIGMLKTSKASTKPTTSCPDEFKALLPCVEPAETPAATPVSS